MTSDFLFAKQSFIRGVASIGNINGNILFSNSDSSAEADSRAIASDWLMTGKDIKGAINEYAGAAE